MENDRSKSEWKRMIGSEKEGKREREGENRSMVER